MHVFSACPIRNALQYDSKSSDADAEGDSDAREMDRDGNEPTAVPAATAMLGEGGALEPCST